MVLIATRHEGLLFHVNHSFTKLFALHVNHINLYTIMPTTNNQITTNATSSAPNVKNTAHWQPAVAVLIETEAHQKYVFPALAVLPTPSATPRRSPTPESREHLV